MSASSKDQYYTGNVGKSRRGSPGETSSVFFQGQGGRTVLPPISSAFPTSRFPGLLFTSSSEAQRTQHFLPHTVPSTYTTPYTQPRSSPARFMLNQSAFYQWGTGNNCKIPFIPQRTPNILISVAPPLPEPSFPSYEGHDRYNPQPSYTAYPSARASSPIPQNPTDSRRLPPLTTSAAGSERWQHGSYPISNNYQTTGIRSPTASYPSAYAPYSANSAYTYLPQSADQLEMSTGLFDLEPHVRSSSPYRSQLDTNFSPPPISPTSATEEPTIKKKRKRADANQLKVLNEVYARTAFPSTEERNALAKQLDMSPRSVQIWYQIIS